MENNGERGGKQRMVLGCLFHRRCSNLRSSQTPHRPSFCGLRFNPRWPSRPRNPLPLRRSLPPHQTHRHPRRPLHPAISAQSGTLTHLILPFCFYLLFFITLIFLIQSFFLSHCSFIIYHTAADNKYYSCTVILILFDLLIT